MAGYESSGAWVRREDGSLRGNGRGRGGVGPEDVREKGAGRALPPLLAW